MRMPIVCVVENDFHFSPLINLSDSRSFRWKFNNSGETIDVGKERHYRNGSTSVLQYTPITDQVSVLSFLISISSIGAHRSHPNMWQKSHIHYPFVTTLPIYAHFCSYWNIRVYLVGQWNKPAAVIISFRPKMMGGCVCILSAL